MLKLSATYQASVKGSPAFNEQRTPPVDQYRSTCLNVLGSRLLEAECRQAELNLEPTRLQPAVGCVGVAGRSPQSAKRNLEKPKVGRYVVPP